MLPKPLRLRHTHHPFSNGSYVHEVALQASIHPGVFTDGRTLFTPNLVPGETVYGERLVREGHREFRAWSPRRSKLAALLLLDDRPLALGEKASILYLGAGTGTTASHLSDLASKGTVYSVEVAPRAFEKLLRLAERRKNIVPILGDAREPRRYRTLVGRVDLLYQDVAQRDQVGILLRNLPSLKDGGQAVLMVKARSVDVAAPPEAIFRRSQAELAAAGWRVERLVPLQPYQKDHAAIVLRR